MALVSAGSFCGSSKQNVSCPCCSGYILVWELSGQEFSLHFWEDPLGARSSLCLLITGVAIQYSNWLTTLIYSAVPRISVFYFNYTKQSGEFSLYQCLYAFALKTIDEETEIWGPKVSTSTWIKIAKLFRSMLVIVILLSGIFQPLISPHWNQYLVLSVIKQIVILM